MFKIQIYSISKWLSIYGVSTLSDNVLLHATIALFVPNGIHSAIVADISELVDYLMS
jgi:hypothetical protein